jgi:PilZ domain
MEPSTYDLRSSHRFPVSYPVIFCGAPFVGEGTVADLSHTGCSITGTESVVAGSYIKLRVLLPDSPSSLLIELGKVRWVHDDAFGVEFIRRPTMVCR